MAQFFMNKDYDYNNRFDLERFVNFTNQYFDILQSPILDILKTFKIIGEYTIREFPYRPDVVSYNIYGDAQYWIYIMIYNGISNVMDLTQGKVITFFSLDDLEKTLYAYSNFNNKIDR